MSQPFAKAAETELRAVIADGRDKKAYVRPRLVRYGEIRTVTLGTSPGVGESGPSGTRNRPTP